MTTLLKYRQRVIKWEGKHWYEDNWKQWEDEKWIIEENKGESDYEAEAEEELNQLITKKEKDEKWKTKKLWEKDNKNEYRKKMSVLASTTVGHNDEEIGFD